MVLLNYLQLKATHKQPLPDPNGELSYMSLQEHMYTLNLLKVKS